jgi:hypothetical protein
MSYESLTDTERRDLIHLIVCNVYADQLADVPLLSPNVRSYVETLELLQAGYELDLLCLPHQDRAEIESLLDGLARVVVARR